MKGKSATREEAVGSYQAKELSHMNVFADGSIANGKAGIGLAAYFKRPNPFMTVSSRIRNNDRIDITSVELAAIRAAVMLIDTYLEQADIEATNAFQATICSDNRKAVEATQQGLNQSGISIVQDIQSYVEHHAALGRQIFIEWIPKKAEIPGHVVADSKARAATSSEDCELSQGLDVPDSITWGWDVLKQTITTRARQHQWSTGNSLRSIDSAIPGEHTLKLYNTLNRKEASILAQLRTGHSRLNGFLAEINISESDQCECGQSVETIRHFLLLCPQFERQRRVLVDKLGPQFGNVPHMVGGRNTYNPTSGSHRDGPAEKWKPDINTVRETIRYALNTGRLDYGEERRRRAVVEGDSDLSSGEQTEETDEEEEEQQS